MRVTLLLVFLVVPALAAPPEVVVVKPVEREVFDHEDFTGRTEASATVEIRSRLTGFVDKVLFKEGSTVKKGDALLQLDDRLQRAELEKAQAEMKRAEAHLKGAELDLSRLTKLGDARAISREEVEKAATGVEEAKAALLANRAAMEITKLNFDFTRIASPIDGRIGRANVTAGNLVREGDGLATVFSLDPTYAAFDVDERTLLRLVMFNRRHGDAKVTAGVALGDEQGFPHKAVIDFIGPSVDPKTGTVRVRAVLPNPKEDFRPGQFVRVRLSLSESRKAIVVPRSAVGQSEANGYFVLIANGKNFLEARRVEIGNVEENDVEIKAGLTGEDRVVRDPARHKAGDEVKPQSTKEPATKPSGLGESPPSGRPLPDFLGTGPALVVTATYPGANAQVLEETVASPIGAQLNGLEKMTHRVCTCSDDGTMKMTLLFETRTELTTAQVLAQNRIALALPALPDVVRQQGITVTKRGVHFAAVALTSPNGRFDVTYLANYMKLQLRDELARVAGVADVSFFGDTEPGRQLRLHIDRDKLTAFGLTAADVVEALRSQALAVESMPGRHPTLTLSGRLPEPGAFKDLMIKATKEGVIRLGVVARLEDVQGWNHTVSLDGKPCAMLLVSRLPDADSKKTAKAVKDRIAELARRLPEGLEVKEITEP
jgi:RND family efflux transporter MFP subunit